MAAITRRVDQVSDVGINGRDDRRLLLQRVVACRQIEKSARIREVLAYVCERTFIDPDVEIHEQEIGTRIFGRAPDYDTSQDNVVRVTISQARKKLEQYFATDGAREPLVLEIPRGQYTPVFRERMVEPVPAPAVDIAASVETTTPDEYIQPQRLPARRGKAFSLMMAAVALVVALLSGWTLLSLRAERTPLESSPALQALWAPLLSTQTTTDVVVADSSLSLFQELLDHQLSLAEYLNPASWTEAEKFAANPDLKKFAQIAAQRRFTSIGSVTTAYRIAQLTGPSQARVAILSARDFNARQMKSDNVVLLGSQRANPWVELIDAGMNFHFGYDQASRHSFFQNRRPMPGEASVYTTDSHTSYCHIAVVPNLGGNGRVMVIAGTEVEGTEGGGEFVTNPEAAALLVSRVGLDGEGKLPYFEVLLKSDRVAGLAPKFSITASRLIGRQ